MTDIEIDLLRKLIMLVSKRTYMYSEIEKSQERIKKCNDVIFILREEISKIEDELRKLEEV